MTRATVPMKQQPSFKETMRQGFQAMSGKDLPTYTLLFLDPARGRMKGEYMNVVVPYLEMGRSSHCAIRFGEDYPTVSRVHTSLHQEGGQILLKHLGTNPTLVNGQPVHDSAALKNGDEIQLSYEGPRIRFNVSTTGTASMKFTQRMALYTRQALAPYRKAVIGLLVLLLISCVSLGYFLMLQSDKNTSLALQVATEHDLNEGNKNKIGELESEITRLENELKKPRGLSPSQRELLEKLKQERNNLKNTVGDNTNDSDNLTPSVNNEANEGAMKSLSAADFLRNNQNDIYLIWVEQIIIKPAGRSKPKVLEEPKHIGTGFLTEDGRFVTARHVVKPWKYPSSNFEIELNIEEQQGGQIEYKFVAFSPSGDKFKFTSNEMKDSDSRDEMYLINDIPINGKRKRRSVKFVKVGKGSETDWAYMYPSDRKGKLKLAPEMATNLASGDKIYVSGYQLFNQTFDPEKGLTPNYSESHVAQSGLVNGTIQTTNTGFDAGSSGGPGIIANRGEYFVVGIVSAALMSRNQASTHGIYVPVSNLR